MSRVLALLFFAGSELSTKPCHRDVLPPALVERCRAVCLAQAEQPAYANGLKRRIMGLLDADTDAFSELLLETDRQLGPVLRAMMGERSFLNSFHW